MQILLYLSMKAGFNLSRIRNVFISIELIFISLIFLASGGECIKDKDVGVRLSTLNLVKSLCTCIWRGKQNKTNNLHLEKAVNTIKLYSSLQEPEILMPKILNIFKCHRLNTVQ